MRSALIAATLLALVLCGCNGGQPEEMIDMFAKMESKLTRLESELAEVKTLVVDLKSELSTCKIELQTLAQQKLQDAEPAVEAVPEEAPTAPEHPSEHPVGAAE